MHVKIYFLHNPQISNTEQKVLRVNSDKSCSINDQIISPTECTVLKCRNDKQTDKNICSLLVCPIPDGMLARSTTLTQPITCLCQLIPIKQADREEREGSQTIEIVVRGCCACDALVCQSAECGKSLSPEYYISQDVNIIIVYYKFPRLAKYVCLAYLWSWR